MKEKDKFLHSNILKDQYRKTFQKKQMIHNDITFNTIKEACFSDNDHQLNMLIEHSYTTIYGFDYIFDDQKKNVLHHMASNLKFQYWDTLLRGFAFLDLTDGTNTPLQIAVLSKNKLACRALIKEGASISVENSQGQNSIDLAIKLNDPEILSIFISNYFGHHYIADNLIAACYTCINNNASDCLRLLFDPVYGFEKSKLTSLDNSGISLIHYAAQATSIKCVQVLLDLGVDINMLSKHKLRPIDYAQDHAMIEFIYCHGGISSQKNNTSFTSMPELHKAAIMGDIEFISKYKGDINVQDSQNNTALISAINAGQGQVVDILLKKGIDPIGTGFHTAYHVAAFKGDISVLHPLIADKHDLDESIILSAIRSKNPIVVQLFLSHINLNWTTSIQKLIESELLTILETDSKIAISMLSDLLKHKFLPSFEFLHHIIGQNHIDFAGILFARFPNYLSSLSDSDAQDLLLTAVKLNSPTLVQIFLDAKIDPSFQSHGIPLFHFTACHPTSDTRTVLYNFRKELAFAKDSSDNTFLHKAAIYGNELAISDGFDKYEIQSILTDSNSPLFNLVQKWTDNFPSLIKLFLDHGLNPATVNSQNQNIFHIAAQFSQEKIIEYLLSDESPLSEEIKVQLANGTDNNNSTPTMVAARSLRRIESRCEALLCKLSPLPVFNPVYLAIHEALDMKLLDAIRQHLQAKFSPDSVSPEGMPLILYILSNREKLDKNEFQLCCKELIKSHVNMTVQFENKNPMHYVVESGDMEILQIFWNHSSFACGTFIKDSFPEGYDEEWKAKILREEKRQTRITELKDQFVKDAASLGRLKLPNVRQKVPHDTKTEELIEESILIGRILDQLAIRMSALQKKTTINTSTAKLLSYFVGAFAEHPNILMISSAVNLEKNLPEIHAYMESPCGEGHATCEDILLQPTNTIRNLSLLYGPTSETLGLSKDHAEIEEMQKAANKVGQVYTHMLERQKFFETQVTIKNTVFKTTLANGSRQFHIDQVLNWHGVFEKCDLLKRPPEPSGSNKLDLPQWGLAANKVPNETENFVTIASRNDLKQSRYFIPVGSSMKAWYDRNSKTPIHVYIFQSSILFGKQKGDNFKLKFSCQTTEAIWENLGGADSPLKVYLPMGLLKIKFVPNNQAEASFEYQDFLKNMRKSQETIPLTETGEDVEASEFEVVYATWVAEESYWTVSRVFRTRLKDTEAIKNQILDFLEGQGIKVKRFNNGNPMLLLRFITYTTPKGQKPNVISDVSY